MSVFRSGAVNPLLLALSLALCGGTFAAGAQGASARVSCGNVSGLAIENLVCQDEELTRLDRLLGDLLGRAASAPATGETARRSLRARGHKWREARNQCWRVDNPRQCVIEHYRHRIARLQVELALVDSTGTAQYRCRDEVLTLRFHATSVPSLTADFRGRKVFMVRDTSAAATRYSGVSLSLSIRPGELLLHRAGTRESPLRCRDSSGQAAAAGRDAGLAECGRRP